MVKTLKTLGYIVSIICFVLCFLGAAKVLSNAQDELWRGVGIFFIGVGIFAGFSLLMLSSVLGTKKAEAKPVAPVRKPAAPAVSKPKPAAKSVSQEPRVRPAKESPKNEGVNLYVGNLANSVSELDLRGEFDSFGQVKSVRIIADRETGEPKGYAFVEMTTPEEAKAAMEKASGLEIKGQAIKVTQAKQRRPRPRRRR